VYLVILRLPPAQRHPNQASVWYFDLPSWRKPIWR